MQKLSKIDSKTQIEDSLKLYVSGELMQLQQ